VHLNLNSRAITIREGPPDGLRYVAAEGSQQDSIGGYNATTKCAPAKCFVEGVVTAISASLDEFCAPSHPGYSSREPIGPAAALLDRLTH
jgi:hypothetical protein